MLLTLCSQLSASRQPAEALTFHSTWAPPAPRSLVCRGIRLVPCSTGKNIQPEGYGIGEAIYTREPRRSSQLANSEEGLGRVTNGGSVRRPNLPRAVHFGRDYWLSRCSGYRVESPTVRVGIVETTLFHTRCDCPDSLVVRTGRLRPQRTTVPVADVAEIEPNGRSIRVSCAIGEDRPSVVKGLWGRVRHSLHPVSS